MQSEDTARVITLSFPYFAQVKHKSFKLGHKFDKMLFTTDFKFCAFRNIDKNTIEIVNLDDTNQRVSLDIKEITNHHDIK